MLLPMTDFVSVGTNDLTQFLFAADRANPRLADRYDWLSPAILRVLRRIVRAAAAAKVPVTVCGEMGGRPLEALALLALGVETLSITPAGVGPIKAMVRAADLGALSAQMAQWLDAPVVDIRARLLAAATAQGIELA
jgi:phosphotransferase system enzyme I (PtsP)